jgi:hypothetical protein
MASVHAEAEGGRAIAEEALICICVYLDTV